jgi:hypothetical protein
MKILFPILLLLLAPLARADDPGSEIKLLLVHQAEAWSQGDIDGFMRGYWQSDELRFASDGTVTRGWKATLHRYKKRYPDRETMGTLTLTVDEVTLLAPDAAIAFGKWELARNQDHPWGLFTLVLRRLPEGWRIVADHTSSAAK